MAEQMVVVHTCSTDIEAELARGLLEASDIPCLLLSDGVASVHPHLQFARGVRVAVPAEHADAARDVLSGNAPIDEDHDVGEYEDFEDDDDAPRD